MVWPFWKTVRQFLLMANTYLSYPAIHLLDIYPSEMIANIHTIICTQMFTAILYIIGKNWNWMSFNWWVGKLWFIHTKEHYSTIKSNKLLMHIKTWKDLRCTKLSQTQMLHIVLFQLNDILTKANYKDRKQISGN